MTETGMSKTGAIKIEFAMSAINVYDCWCQGGTGTVKTQFKCLRLAL